jgi:regulation of enolase protein 1 (concanavalin A-like superfamily)
MLFALLSAMAASVNAQTGATPGDLTAYSTIYSIGLEWNIGGDTDHDAKAEVEYQVAAGGDWKPAMPLVRIDHNGRNMLAGSLLFLAPDTEYAVRVSLIDPDGGGDWRETTVRTRPVPAAPSGRVFHVTPGDWGGDGSPGAPFLGIAAAQAVAQPGDTFLLHGGYYGGRIVFSAPGTAAAYVAWRAAGDGEVTMAGIDILAGHIWLEGLTIRDQHYGTRTENAPTNVVLTRSFFFNNHYSIFLSGGGSNWYIADNVIVGNTPAASGNDEGEGIELLVTNGHTVAHNRITNVADGISYPRTNVDIFGNDIFDTADDGIELDNGLANVRVWGNRIHNPHHHGMSFQPQSGGPWYIVRNQIVGGAEAPFKFRTTDRFVLLHNTIVNWGGWMFCCQPNDMLKAIARNNLWISATGGQMWSIDAGLSDWRTDLDYEGFDWGTGAYPFWYGGAVYYDVASFSRASGLVTHGIRVFKESCFEDFQMPGPAPTPVPPHVMTLHPWCNAVDAGAVLPNINDGFSGSAPDLGAHESGAPMPWYGPRAADAPPPAVVPPSGPAIGAPSAVPPSLPAPWLYHDVGAVGVAGTALESGGQFSVSASGADVWASADAFGFSYRALTGNGTIVARVVAQQHTHAWAKAGVMMRASLAAGSPHAFMFVTPGGVNGLAFQHRSAQGGATAHTSGGWGSAPVWVGLVRSGDTIAAYHSPDGVNWNFVGSATVSMAETVYVGLAVTSHDNGALGTAAFDNVIVDGGGSASGGGLPSPWANGDVGSVGIGGAVSFDGATWAVGASGADVWGTADGFHYAYRSLSGDGSIVARVANVQSGHPWAKAGVMMRASLAAGSPHAFMFVTPSGVNGLAFQHRSEQGGATVHTSGGSGSAPVWVGLVRGGDTISAYHSPDGINWNFVGSATVSMVETIYVGLAVTSHDNGTLGTAAFDNVSVAEWSSAAWSSGDIGAVGAAGYASSSGNAWSVEGGGADIWGTSDGFHYVRTSVSGDFTVTRASSPSRTSTSGRRQG